MDELQYDPIIMDPLEDLFNKIYDARGGEMIMIHLNEYNKNGHPSIKLCSIVNKDKSTLLELLPPIVDNLINRD